jgi:putative Holliday junction resolvase
MGVLAIDPGTRKTGFAIADRLRIALHALPSYRGDDGEGLLRHVAELLDERDVSVLLVGLPLSMDGTEGESARHALGLAGRLRERFDKREILTYDERLTTKEAESRLRELGYRGRAIAQRRDSWSALVLLEDWVRSGEPR